MTKLTMRLRFIFPVAVALGLIGFQATAQQQADGIAGDAERGRHVFKKCAGCHMIGPDARNRVGPPLNNILSARAAGEADFRYSKSLQKAGHDGLHWTPETLDRFLEAPKAMIPRTKMSFRGLKSAEDRLDLIAFLQTLSGDSLSVQTDAGFTVSADILAIEGDVEYGAYLASECTTCHRADGDNDGIPGITGWQAEVFVTAMHAYREKHRENPVMQMIAGRLAAEEIAALAAYFNGLEN